MDGIILINKPKNNTSHDIVRKVKKLLNQKVGHTGTLDPNATGVLPLLIGKGTELSKYLINHDKIYEAILQLGEKRDTADIEGNVVEEKDVSESCLDKANIANIFKSFIGIQEQIPPIYSAIKVNGKKLYEYARKGENIEVQPRKIEIYSMELIDVDKTNKQIHFRVKCSKGTYIRTLCEDIAYKLQTVGYMKELKRTQVGEFKIEDAITIEQLEDIIKYRLKKEEIKDNNENNLEEKFEDGAKNELKEKFKNSFNNNSKNNSFISIEEYFNNKENINLDERKLNLFLNGVKLTFNLNNDIYKIYSNNKFIGTGVISNNLLKRDIVI